MTRHFEDELALFLCALEPNDSQRMAAEAHARQCATCALRLARAQCVLALIDRQARSQPADPTLRERILSSVASEPQAAERRVQPRAGLPRKLSDAALRAWTNALPIIAVSSLTLAWLDGRTQGWYALAGLTCAVLEVAVAALPLTAAVVWTWQRPRPLTPSDLARLSCLGGFLGQLSQRTLCPHHTATAHLMLFHCAGLALAAATGGFMGRLLRSVRATS